MNAVGRNHGGERWRGKLPVPRHAHPLVRQLFVEANSQKTTMSEIAERAGLQRRTIADWKFRRNPHVPSLVAAFNVLGLDLVVAPLKERA